VYDQKRGLTECSSRPLSHQFALITAVAQRRLNMALDLMEQRGAFRPSIIGREITSHAPEKHSEAMRQGGNAQDVTRLRVPFMVEASGTVASLRWGA